MRLVIIEMQDTNPWNVAGKTNSPPALLAAKLFPLLQLRSKNPWNRHSFRPHMADAKTTFHLFLGKQKSLESHYGRSKLL